MYKATHWIRGSFHTKPFAPSMQVVQNINFFNVQSKSLSLYVWRIKVKGEKYEAQKFPRKIHEYNVHFISLIQNTVQY